MSKNLALIKNDSYNKVFLRSNIKQITPGLYRASSHKMSFSPRNKLFLIGLTSGKPERPVLIVVAAAAPLRAGLFLDPDASAGRAFDLIRLYEKVHQVKLVLAVVTFKIKPGHGFTTFYK